MSSQNEQILKAKNSELEKELGSKLLELQQKNRDLEIESSLERVRIIAMNMKHPDDLLSICEVLYTELVRLGFTELRNTVINIIDDSTGSFLNNDFSQFAGANVTTVSYNSHPATEYLVKQIKSANDAFTELVIKGSELEEWRNYLKGLGKKEDPRLQNIPELLYYFYSIGVGEIGISTYSSITEEKRNLLKRFRNVFDFSYRRYTDIARAEAQTREAKIEAALERVRARSMAMRNSNELADASAVLFHELKTLGIETIRTGVHIMDKEAETSELWMTSESNDEERFEKRGLGLVSMHIHANALLFFNAWKDGEQYYSFELNGDEVRTHYDALSIPKQDSYNQKECVTGFFFPEGSLNLVTHKPLTNDVCNLMKRFALVFGLIYRRFLDLKEAEARAIDAVKRASLDRVRAEIASMRTTSDLEKITPLIWNELKTLSVPFTRCGVFIMNDQQQQVDTFLSTPEGKAIAAFRLPYNAHKEIAQITAHWDKKERYIQHWDEAAFNDWSNTLVERGFVTTGEKYLTENRPTNLHLHFLPFMQGMLYAGSDTPLNKDELQSVQNLADAFSIAYARYEDFNKLESAKEQIEKTLIDLKQAQAQLIQSEKMASLGTLTAGIAHEIQNPLNFVNNFSEVNNELIEEMRLEIKNGNTEEARNIAGDIKDNNAKITHHGNRANEIVKGMLQHSKSSSGNKELTDINKLSEEYLRLSYHGIKAKDNSFNVTMITDFNEAIGKINIIPQSIARLLLNLYNNAFYAVNEKCKQQIAGYEPSVSVSTKQLVNKVEIIVKDNGIGIPQKLIEKIFLPFFTTKPTGQGTGLGLSLSYDIVKAHGGELKVETKESEGSEFIIQLPIV